MSDKINPNHYKYKSVECIYLTRQMGFNLGNAVKYLWRYEEKNGIEDLQKADWYLTDMIENTMDVTFYYYQPLTGLQRDNLLLEFKSLNINRAMQIIFELY